ncbi:MAG: hypothetical protein WCO45_09575, partial [Pseudanabaena sp. ELA607]
FIIVAFILTLSGSFFVAGLIGNCCNWINKRTNMRHPQTDAIINELRDRLIETYSDRLIAIILFGSQSRCDATPDSELIWMLVSPMIC